MFYLALIYFALGLIVEGIINTILKIRSTVGTMRIDRRSERDVYRLEISDLDGLSKKKYIVLRVDNDADLSQK